MPQWDRISGEVILTAMGLAFFKMSVGMGCMLIYGSYFKEEVNIPATALRVMVCDLLVSLLAGMAIFPAVFSFDFEVTQGPALLFMTIPAVFASLPGGHLLATLFFVLSGIAATGAILSLLEVPVSCLAERLNCSRARAVPAVLLGLMLLGAPATLSLGIWNDVRVFGMTFFDMYDALSSMLLMPVCGIATCLFVGYSPAGEQVLARLGDGWAPRAVRQLCRTATPLLILLVLLHGLGLI